MTKNAQPDFSGKSRLAVNVITSWLSHLLIIVTGFFMPRVIDAQLGQSIVGIWDFAWSLVAYLSLAQLGIGSSLNRFVANFRAQNENEKLQTAISTVTLIQFIISLFIATVIATIAYFLPSWYHDRLGEDVYTAQLVVLFLGLAIAAQFLFDTSRGVLTGSHRWDLYNALYSGTQLICSLIMISALLLGHGLVTISLIYLSMITVEGIARSLLALKICPQSRFRFSAISIAFAKEITSFGLKAFTMGISGIIVIQGCNIMVASTIGHAALAIIARPNALIRHIQTFITRFTFVLTPMAGPIMSQEGPEALRAFTLDCTRYGLAFTLPIITLFGFYGDELIYVWMGPHYVNQNLVHILALGFALSLSQGSMTRIMIGLNYHGKAAFITIGLSLPMFAIGLLIIEKVGHSLEAYAMLMGAISTTVHGIALPCYACYKLEIPLLTYIRSVFGRMLPLWAPTTLLLIFLDLTAPDDKTWVLFNSGVYGLMTAALYWRFILPFDTKQKIRANYLRIASTFR